MIYNFKFRQFIFSLLTPMVKFNDWLINNIGLYNGIKRLRQLNLKEADKVIRDKIISGKPFAVARYGHSEFCAIMKVGNYKWRRKRLNRGGVHVKIYQQWEDLYWETAKNLDVLATWNYRSYYLAKMRLISKLPKLEHLVPIEVLGPFDKIWIEALKDKKVLVIYPFVKSIELQYKKRELLGVLPRLKALSIMKPIESYCEIGEEFDWFGALEQMKDDIRTRDFDIALLGCGMYGFPLSTYIKQLGKQAIHIGGVTQLLFGIKGQRWEKQQRYRNKFNEHWIYPLEEDIHPAVRKVEDGCYIGPTS